MGIWRKEQFLVDGFTRNVSAEVPFEKNERGVDLMGRYSGAVLNDGCFCIFFFSEYLSFFFFYIYIYIYIWLHQVLVVAHGIFFKKINLIEN